MDLKTGRFIERRDWTNHTSNLASEKTYMRSDVWLLKEEVRYSTIIVLPSALIPLTFATLTEEKICIFESKPPSMPWREYSFCPSLDVS